MVQARIRVRLVRRMVNLIHRYATACKTEHHGHVHLAFLVATIALRWVAHSRSGNQRQNLSARFVAHPKVLAKDKIK
jgi:hypothetical protein